MKDTTCICLAIGTLVLLMIVESSSVPLTKSLKKPKTLKIASYLLPNYNVTYLSSEALNDLILGLPPPTKTIRHKLRPRKGVPANATMCNTKALQHCCKRHIKDVRKLKAPKSTDKNQTTPNCVIRKAFFTCLAENSSRKPCKVKMCRDKSCSGPKCQKVPCPEKKSNSALMIKRDLEKFADYLWYSRQCVFL